MNKEDYLSLMKQGLCPSCKKPQPRSLEAEPTFDLDYNTHSYIDGTDAHYFSCTCGCHWMEKWTMTDFTIIEPDAWRFWNMEYTNGKEEK